MIPRHTDENAGLPIAGPDRGVVRTHKIKGGA